MRLFSHSVRARRRNLLDRGDEQTNQDGDNRNHDQKLDQGKGIFTAAVRLGRGMGDLSLATGWVSGEWPTWSLACRFTRQSALLQMLAYLSQLASLLGTVALSRRLSLTPGDAIAKVPPKNAADRCVFGRQAAAFQFLRQPGQVSRKEKLSEDGPG